jgi:hypothetical protein
MVTVESGDQVDVGVVDGLSSSVPDVDADVEAVGLQRLKETTMLAVDQCEAVGGLRRGEVEEVGAVAFRDDEGVPRRHRVCVSNGEGARVRVDDARGRIAERAGTAPVHG